MNVKEGRCRAGMEKLQAGALCTAELVIVQVECYS